MWNVNAESENSTVIELKTPIATNRAICNNRTKTLEVFIRSGACTKSGFELIIIVQNDCGIRGAIKSVLDTAEHCKECLYPYLIINSKHIFNCWRTEIV